MLYQANKQKGLTLFELLITITILGILATFALPNMLSLINNYKINTTSSDVVGIINSAKTEAVKYNSPIAITAGYIRTNGKLNSTAKTWADGNAVISYQIISHSIYGNINYQTKQDRQVANFKKNVTVTPEIRIDSKGEREFKEDDLILIAYPNGSMKITSLANKTNNTEIIEGATIKLAVCIKKKCKDIIIASNNRAYIGDSPSANNTSKPPATVVQGSLPFQP